MTASGLIALSDSGAETSVDGTAAAYTAKPNWAAAMMLVNFILEKEAGG